MTSTIGSLFSGAGGLDMGVQMTLRPADLRWVSDVEPGPCALLTHHWPEVPNLGDITTVDWTQVEPVDVIAGGSPCFVAGTPVLTHDGLRPIEDVQVGDLVWTHAARWQRVTHTMRRTSETVEFRSGFYCTPEHRLWLRAPQQRWNDTIRQYRRHLDTPEWVEAKDSRGLFAASPVSVTHEGVPKPDTLTWWQIGRFVADGYVSHQVNVYIGKGKESDADNFPGWVHHQQETALCLTMPKSAAERDWLTGHFGKLAHGKTIPAFLLAETEENRRAFLDGYWSGDGWKPEGRRFTQSNSVSACLTTGIELLAKSLGYTCTVSQCQVAPTKVIEGRTVNQRPWWMVRATPADGRFTETDADWHWFKLRRTPTAGEVTTVYDLGVERDHSFIAAGIVVHNCQDLSLAGARKGMKSGTRSGLWESMFHAIRTIRPHLVVWENVRGAYSADAFSLMESREGRVGGGADGPVLRALGRVLGDLASVGYDAIWTGVRASDVGAPHQRYRVFVAAHPAGDTWWLQHRDGAANANTEGIGLERGRSAQGRGDGSADSGESPVALVPAPRCVNNENRQSEGCNPNLGAALLPTPTTQPTTGNGHARDLGTEVRMLPTPTTQDTDEACPSQLARNTIPLNGLAAANRFGDYAPAIERWERLLRPAPDPTEPNDRGGRRLSARFVEWMQGMPDGHVTSIGLTRIQQLRILGNIVVPQQAAHALRLMRDEERAMEGVVA